MKTDFTATKKTIASAVESANSLNINSLEQAELVLRQSGLIMDGSVDGKDLLNLCQFKHSTKNWTLVVERQIKKHNLLINKDYFVSYINVGHGNNGKKKVYKFSIYAANQILLGAMTTEGKKARHKAIVRELVDPSESCSKLADSTFEMFNPQPSQKSSETTSSQPEPVEPVQAEPKDSIDSKYKRIHEIDPDALAKLNPILEAINPIYQQMLTLAETVNPGQSDYRYAASIATEKLTGFNLLNLFDTPKPSATVTRIKPDAHQSELKLVPKNDQDPRLLGYKRKVTQTYSRTTLRDKGIYGLDNYKSWYELQDVCDMSSKEIREHFVELGLIKLCERGAFSESKKYILTADGWDFGTMYDPVRDEFHGADSKRLLTSDAQPVFGYEVLDLLI